MIWYRRPVTIPGIAFVFARNSVALLSQSPPSATRRQYSGNSLFRFPGSSSRRNVEDDGTGDDEIGDGICEGSRELFDKMTWELVGGANPFASTLNRIGKGDLYEDDELMNVLSMHNRFANEVESTEKSEAVPSLAASPQLSLHDVVLAAISDETSLDSNVAVGSAVVNGIGAFSKPAQPLSYQIDTATKARVSRIRAIASDVDGTLLSSRRTVHPRTRMAIKRAIELTSAEYPQGYGGGIDFFFPATGKSRKGALDSLGIEIGSLIAEANVPGVYLQGLYCVDGEGNVVFERKLNIEAIAAAEKLVKDTGISIVAFDGDDLYTTDATDIVVHLHEHYGEPLPRLLPTSGETVRSLYDHGQSMHKLLLMDDDIDKLKTVVRPQLEELAEKYGACVTQALPTMLELLPAGCSKALGVTKVCSALGVDMTKELLALGDAENDAEMLNMAAIGVAMGNGCPAAKDAADFVMDLTNDDGAAGAAMELFAFGDIE